LVLLINVYTLSSRKLEIRAKLFLPGSKEVAGREKWGREKGGDGGKGRNDLNIVCTYE
jgi:hypothetical protein